jgi:hypothetical protein
MSIRSRVTLRYPRPKTLLSTRRRARLARFDDPVSAEDDYFRLANRGH